MTWPRTLADLFHLALLVAGGAQGVVFVLLALLLVAFIWWVFKLQRNPDASLYNVMRQVLLLAFLAAVILAFVPLVRWIRQLTSCVAEY
jgi:hypothetical protein